MNNTGTCQICERVVKTPNGLTSHHGYKRPGGGWQTASCMGARELPYEKSCNLIPIVIERIENYRNSVSETIDSYKTNPPTTIEEKNYNYWTQKETVEVYKKPAKFDIEKALNSDYRYDDKYSREFYRSIKKMNKDVEECNYDIKRLQKRINDWKLVD